MLQKLFGGGQRKQAPVAVNPQSTSRTVNAIDKLGETEGLLVKRRDLLEKKIAQELEKAKQCLHQKNKRAALMAMKKKKMYEAQLEQVENNILRINEQQMMLENQRTTVETVLALKTGADASKSTMKEMKIDDVDRVLEDINEQNDQMRQIQDAMGAPIGAAAELDEDELLEELEELEASELDRELLQPAPVPASRMAEPFASELEDLMPSVPGQRPAAAPKQKTPEELELEALQAELAL